MGNANSGPKPKPTALKLLSGVARKDRLNPAEPRPEGDVVKPANLSKDAGIVWDEVAPICLQMGTLTAADVRAFSAYCELQATFTRNSLLKDGGVGFDPRLEGDTANKLRPFYDYFGMTPPGRARISVPKKTEEPASKWAGALK